MIIWGFKPKEHVVGSGQFFCPGCMASAPYSLVRISRYFTLYFIPLFPTRTLGEFVRCGACHAELPDAVLRYSREEILRVTQPWVCANCNNHNPRSESRCLACGAAYSLSPPPLPSAPPQALPSPAATESGRCPICNMIRAHKAGCPNGPPPTLEY